MLQNFANFLLGSVRNQPDESPATAGAGAGAGAATDGVENTTLRLTSAEEAEDEWVLVDRDSEGNSECSGSVESLDRLEYADDLLIVDGVDDDDAGTSSSPALLTRTSSTASLPCLVVSTMDESWFVTPPPCFMSTGPVHMETSPLENLLIEHPSMSVYTHHVRRHLGLSRVASPARSYAGNDADVEVVVDVGDYEEDDVVVVRRAPRYNRVHLLQQMQEKQGLKSKQAQKVQIKQTCKVLQRGPMDRNNKAREVNSRNRRQRRGERSQGAQRSYANNNRKC